MRALAVPVWQYPATGAEGGTGAEPRNAAGAEVESAVDQDASPRGFPWRGLLLGLVLIPPTTLFGVYAYVVAQATLWTQTSLLRGPVFVLFFIVLANLLVRRFRARWGLAELDLLVLYAMQCVATATGGIGWAQFLVPSLGSPRYYATKENQFEAFWDHIPNWWWIRDEAVVRNLYRGHSSLYDLANWAGVVRPLLTWGVFCSLLALAALCLAQLLREQWVRRERLTFPLAYLPLEMTRGGGERSFWKNPYLWLGFGIVAFIDTANALHFVIPAVPEITVKPINKLKIDAAWTTKPLSALRPFVLSFYPFMIGIGFLLTTDVSFSCWAWFLILKAVSLVAVVTGLADGPLQVGQFPYLPEQSVGAFAALAGLALWRSRGELIGAFRNAADRNALIGLVACLLLMLWFVAAVGLPLWLGAAWVALYLVFAVGCSRIVSETGSGWTFAPRILPHDVILRFPGAPGLGPRPLTLFAWLMPFDLDFRDAVMPQYLKGMKLLPDDGGRGRPLLLALVLASVVGVLAGLWAHFHVYFQYGVDTAVTRRWPAQVGRQPFDVLANQLRGNAPAPYSFGGVLAGAGLLLGLVALRTRWLGWPFHPIGFALATTQALDYLWMPFLIAWVTKCVVLRYGGMKLYRRLMPFFLGLILGDYVVPLLWAAWAAIAHQQTYLSFPH